MYEYIYIYIYIIHIFTVLTPGTMVMMDIYYVHFVDDISIYMYLQYLSTLIGGPHLTVPFDGVQGTISRKQTTKSLRKMRVEAVSLVETREKHLIFSPEICDYLEWSPWWCHGSPCLSSPSRKKTCSQRGVRVGFGPVNLVIIEEFLLCTWLRYWSILLLSFWEGPRG